MPVPRRALLAASVSLAAAACAPRGEHTPPGPERPDGGATASGPSAAASATPTRTQSPSPTPARPSRAALVEEYGTRKPTAFGTDLPGVVCRTPADAVCLTFDACGGRRGSGVDRALLEVLATTETPATLFLNARWIDANPSFARDLAAAPHLEIQDHGTRHRPLTVDGRAAYGIRGTRDVGELVDEVLDNRARLAALTGVEPTCFRAGTAHVDDVAVEICTRLGVRLVHFDVNADAGATFTPDEVRRALLGVRAGSIAIGHCNQPGSGTAAGVRRAIPELRDRGVRFARLSDALAG